MRTVGEPTNRARWASSLVRIVTTVSSASRPVACRAVRTRSRASSPWGHPDKRKTSIRFTVSLLRANGDRGIHETTEVGAVDVAVVVVVDSVAAKRIAGLRSKTIAPCAVGVLAAAEVGAVDE